MQRRPYLLPPDSTPRYIAQCASFSILREDIYGNSMEYHGPGLKLALVQGFWNHFRLSVNAETRYSLFNAPALDLSGVETSSHPDRRPRER